ncbi:MAG: TonB-dependent receptor [Spongiibacteraceae bacterium]
MRTHNQVALVSLLLASSLVSAESDADSRRSRVIEEVIVTAQKTEQTLQEVPVAVSVVSGDTLSDAGIFDASGLENRVPNLELDMDPQAPSIGIRGFSTDSFNIGLEPSVGIVFDEVPLGRSEFIPSGLYDISRVEVLRGPQGTLFGKNTIAGALIFATGQPTDEQAASLMLSGDEHGSQRLEAVLNQPLGDRVLARLAVVAQESAGEIDNSFLHRDELETQQLAGRLRFTIDASDKLQLRLGGQYADTETLYSPWQLYDVDSDALAYAQSIDPDTEDDPYDFHTSFDLPGFVNGHNYVAHAIADYALSDQLSIMLIAGHAGQGTDIAMDYDVSAADLVGVRPDYYYQQDSLELRLLGQNTLAGIDFDFVGGVFAMQSDMGMVTDIAMGEDAIGFLLTPAGLEALGLPAALEPVAALAALTGIPSGALLGLIPLPSPVSDDGVTQSFSQQAESVAVFGQVSWFLTDKLTLITGLRLSEDRKDGVVAAESRGLGLTALIMGAEVFSDDNLQRRDEELSPKLGLQYEFNDSVSSYLSWTRGSKGGGFNGISFNSDNLVFEPEQGDNIELGVKTRLLDESMTLNATVYHTAVSDMQVVNFNGISFDVFNAAESVLEGVELDMAWLTPLHWLSVNATLSVSRAEYQRYEDAPAAAGSEDCDNDDDCSQDLSGRTLPKAPVLTASIGPVVTLPIGDSWGVELGVDISHRGEQYLELDLDPHSFQKAHTLIDARISVGAEDDSWSVTLTAQNLGDTEALNFVADHNLYASSYFSSQIPGARMGLTVKAAW